MSQPDGRMAFARGGSAAALAALVFTAFCLANGEGVALSEFPLDDGWIHQVYVRGLLVDGLPTYNPGVPEAGFSSPLWLLVSLPFAALSRALGATPVVAIKLASLAFAALTTIGLGRLAMRLAGPGARPRLALLAISLAWLTPGFAFSAVSGMEVTLAAALLAFALIALFDERLLRAGLLLAGAVWARPEALLVVGIVCASWVWRRRGAGLVPLLLPTVLAALVWATYNLVVTGRPLPNTFYVKAASSTLPWQVRAAYIPWRIVFDAGWSAGLLGLLLFAVGVRAAFTASRSPVVLATLLTVLGACAALVVTHPLSPPVLFYSQRYFYPFTTLALVFVALGLDATLARLGARVGAGGVRLVTAGAAVVSMLVLSPGLRQARARYLAHCRDIRQLHTLPALDVKTWVLPGEVVAAEGAGASRFFSERRVLDVVGLNSHAIAHADTPERRNCLLADGGPALLLVPEAFLADLAPGFAIEPLRRYESRHWSVVGGQAPRVVVAARARVRPEIVPYCLRVLGRAAPTR